MRQSRPFSLKLSVQPVLWLLLAGALVQPVRALPPTNDVCIGAEIIPSNATFPYLTAVTVISDATTIGDPPLPSCAFDTRFSHSIWYTFTPRDTAFYTISSCADAPTMTTVPDTLMAIYTSNVGCPGATNELPFGTSTLGCADDTCGPGFTQAAITTRLLADATYYIVVWQFDPATPPPNATVQLQVSKTLPPSNDSLAGAIDVFLNLPVLGTTVLASNDYQLPAGSTCFTNSGQIGNATGSMAPGRDVVYSFTAPAAGTYSIKVNNYRSSCWDKVGDCYDLVIYAASSLPTGPPPATVTSCLSAANRNPATEAEEILCLPLTAAQKIYIVVDEDLFSPGGSIFTLEVTKCLRETEPNNTWINAGLLSFGIEGTIQPSSDIDYYSLGAPPAGSRVFAMLDGSAANVPNFQMRVIAVSTNAPTSTNTLEFDADNNDPLFGEKSANVAGTPLTGIPTFLRVTGGGALAEEPYRLYAVVQPPFTNATMETEPNDTIGSPNPMAANNYFYGALAGPAPSTDVDVYPFSVEAADGVSDLIFLSLDGDPLRNNTPINAKLELLDESGDVLVAVDDTAGTSSTTASTGFTGTTPNSPGEAIIYRTLADGTYYARVSLSPNATALNGAGDYLLSISRNGFAGCCGVNTAPTLASAFVTSPINEYDLATLTGTVADPDAGQSHQVAVDWGDGSALTTTNLLPWINVFTLTHRYLDSPPSPATSNSYRINLTVSDNLGGSTPSSLIIAVSNVPPSAPALTLSATNINENDSVMLSGSFTDPGTLDTHIVNINWGDGSAHSVLNLPAGTLVFNSSHQYRDDNPTGTASDVYTISVTVTDDDGGVGTASTTLTVNNLPPALGGVTITSPIAANGTATLSGTFSDPGTQDTFSLSVNWGDGSALFTTNMPAGSTSFGAAHHYTISNSNAPVSVVLQDDDGGMATTNLTVMVGAQSSPPHLQLLLPYAAGHVKVKLQGAPTTTYRIQTSALLSNDWSNFSTNTTDAGGLFQIEDTNSPVRRFYRAVAQ